MSKLVRRCPLCAGNPSGRLAFPWLIGYEGTRFSYHSCRQCGTVFVNPIPNERLIASMYKKSTYHDEYYPTCKSEHYISAASLLLDYVPAGSTVLDYGCGSGFFLRSAQSVGFSVSGVEFDKEAAIAAARHANCDVWTVEDFSRQGVGPRFDVIHLGDVLEHLPNPKEAMSVLLTYIRPGGILFAEGPLEINPSPVYWAANLFGHIKRIFRPNFIGEGRPTHLFLTAERQQLAFFCAIKPELNLIYWKIYDTGWPYAEGGRIKGVIAKAAIALSGKQIAGKTFGNRFIGIFRFNNH